MGTNNYYESPTIIVEEIIVEHGIAASFGGSDNDPMNERDMGWE